MITLELSSGKVSTDTSLDHAFLLLTTEYSSAATLLTARELSELITALQTVQQELTKEKAAA